ncbi:hypothetical protein HYDPIDRAFT_117058 [Hydnomerulius pinastri MD-312]|uniref:WD40 repeat-like protein n=1 Tax=Hydnomerulius pinastri MD-312 TaxID=994086 RepID=A0A0C9W339_9AGAM|nr:hypothetical protein HYDPIDRAFT_117058 [Hydnomerulius pinastri MD-312]
MTTSAVFAVRAFIDRARGLNVFDLLSHFSCVLGFKHLPTLQTSPRPTITAPADMTTSSSSVDTSSLSNSVVSKSESRPVPIHTYEGHERGVTCVAFLQDEQRLVTGSWDGNVRVWNRETGAQIGNDLQGHTGAVNAVVVSPDGRTIASGSDDNTVRIWDAETEELLHTLGHEDSMHWVTSVHISPDSKRVALGSDDRTLQVWDIETGELVFKPIKCNGQAWCVRYSPSGDRIASAARSIRIWKADTAEHILSIGGEVASLAWSLDGEQIIGGGDEDIIIWDSSTGEQIRSWKAHDIYINSLSLSRNGTHLATCSVHEKTVFVFDITTGEQIAAYEHDSNLHWIAYSPSGRFIATACVDKKVYLWDAPGDPQPTSQKSPAFSPLDLPAVVPQGDHSQGSEQQGCEYTNFFDLSAAADRSIDRHQPTSTTPRRSLSRFKHAITRPFNRREGSRAGGEDTGRRPSWWKRTRLRAPDQPPPVGDDRSSQRHDPLEHAQAHVEPENEGARRQQMPQRDWVAEGRDRRIFAWETGPFPDEIEHGCFYHLASYICYGRRDPDLPIPEETARPNSSEATGLSRVVDVFRRVLLFLHLRNAQPADAIPLQPLTTSAVVPSTSVPPQSSSLNNVASVGPHDPAAARPAPPVVVISPAVDTSTAVYPSSSSDPSPTLSLTSPSRPSPSTPPVVPSSAGFPPTSPMVDTHSSSQQDADLSSLPPDEASILSEYRRQKSRFTVATGTPGEPLHDIEAIASQSQSMSSLQTLGPIVHRSPSSRPLPSPRHLSPLDSLLGVQDTSSLPQPSSGQPSSSSIALITDTDPVDAAGPLSPAPAEHDLEPDAPLLMSPASDLWAGSRTDIETNSSPVLEYENPWASD